MKQITIPYKYLDDLINELHHWWKYKEDPAHISWCRMYNLKPDRFRKLYTHVDDLGNGIKYDFSVTNEGLFITEFEFDVKKETERILNTTIPQQ